MQIEKNTDESKRGRERGGGKGIDTRIAFSTLRDISCA